MTLAKSVAMKYATSHRVQVFLRVKGGLRGKVSRSQKATPANMSMFRTCYQFGLIQCLAPKGMTLVSCRLKCCLPFASVRRT